MSIKCSITLFLAFLLFGCSSSSDQEYINNNRFRGHEVNPRAIPLNDEAMDLLISSYRTNDNSKVLELREQSLLLLDSAVMIDSLFEAAYQNQINILRQMRRYNDALKTLEKVAEISNNAPMVVVTQAFLIEKTGDLEKAKLYYEKAEKAFEEAIEFGPENLNYELNYAFLLLFTKGEDKANDEIDRLYRKHKTEEVKYFKDLIMSFNRKEFIKNF